MRQIGKNQRQRARQGIKPEIHHLPATGCEGENIKTCPHRWTSRITVQAMIEEENHRLTYPSGLGGLKQNIHWLPIHPRGKEQLKENPAPDQKRSVRENRRCRTLPSLLREVRSEQGIRLHSQKNTAWNCKGVPERRPRPKPSRRPPLHICVGGLLWDRS